MKDEIVELLCTIYDKDGEIVERLTFKMNETTPFETMQKCDHILYKWAEDNGLDYDDYWFGYRIISRERKKK